MTVYPASLIKRNRRTKADTEQLESQIIEVLVEDNPQSVRHIFYRMTNPRLPVPVDKSDHGYQQIQHLVKKLRRNGAVPYNWISDATRRGYHTTTYSSRADFIERMAGLYRADLWRESEAYVEVWVESRSVAGVVEALCEDLAVSLYPTGGFSSISLAYQAAEDMNDHLAWCAADGRPKTPVIYYVGDYDPAGVIIDRALEDELRRHMKSDFQFVRVGITESQIEAYDLPTKPRKVTDRRALHVKSTVEAEAMPANLLRGLLVKRIEQWIPEGALRAAKAAEQSEIEGLRAIANAIRGAA